MLIIHRCGKLYLQRAAQTPHCNAHVWVENAQLRIGRRLAMSQPKGQLEQTGYTCRRLSVPHVRLDPANKERHLLARREHSGRERARLNGVAKLCTRAVRLVDRQRTDICTCIAQRCHQQSLLRLTIGRSEARRAPVLPNCAAKDAERRIVAISQRNPTARLSTHKTIGACVKRVRASACRGHTRYREADAPRWQEHKTDARNESNTALV
jgi:hypothetical protein